MLGIARVLRCAAGRGPFDPYKILGVTPDASKDDIKKAYHRLALRFHPDGGPEGNAERFAAVNEAYEAVKDKQWKPSAKHGATPPEEGAGWDPNLRMYVYEKPGSTNEGYVSGQTEKMLRLCMVGCFLFVFFRMFLYPFVLHRRSSNGLVNSSDQGNLHVTTHDVGSASVHANEDAEWAWAKGETTFVDERQGTAVDPLQRMR